MKYSVKHNKKKGICIVKVTGEVRRPDDSKKLQQVALGQKTKNSYSRFLFDMREAKIISDTIKTYETAIAAQVQGLKQYDYNIVLLYSGDINDHKFMETVLINRGYNVHVTNKPDEAMEWLSPKS